MSDEKKTDPLDRELLQSIPTGVGVFDVTGHVIDMKYVNDGYYQMISAKREDRAAFNGASVVEAIYPEDRSALLQEALAAIQEKRLFAFHFRVLSGNGAYIWIGIRANYVPLNEHTKRFYASYYNIDLLKNREQELQNILNSQNFLVGLIQLLNEPRGFSRHIQALLEQLGTHLEAERTYLFILDGDHKTVSNTQAWCRKGISPQKDLLQRVGLHYIDRWMPFFNRRESVVVSDIMEIRYSQPDEYEIMARQSIHSYVEAPIFHDETFVGFIGIDNPSKDKVLHTGGPLLSLAYFISAAMVRERNERQLHQQAETLRQSEASERDLRRIYEAAMEGAELFVWTYDIKHHTVTLMDNPFTKRRSAELKISHELTDVPDCFMEYMDDRNCNIVRDWYAQVEAGAPKASCTVCYTPSSEQHPMVLKLTYVTVCGADGKPDRAYGTSQNITKQRVAAESYRQELAFFNSLEEKNLIAKGHHNLTLNRILRYVPVSDKVLDIDDRTPFSVAYASFSMAPTQAQDRARFREMTSRQNLISLYAEGRNSFSYEFPREKAKNFTTWVRVEVRTFEMPDTGDIECFIYAYDITENHLAQILIQRMTALGYDYIGIINLSAQTYTFRGLRFPSEHDTELDVFDYNDSILAATKAHVPTEEQFAVLESASLAKIIAELKKNESYSFHCNFIDSEKTMRRKLFQYCYLDQEADNIFFCKSDITKQYALEQEQLCHMKDALDAAEKANRAKTEFVSRISHDIRTPIGIISNMTKFAREDIDDRTKLEYDLNGIETSNTFLLSLINDVLDISKINSGKIELHPEPYPLEEHDANIHNVLEPLCAEQGLTYRIERRNQSKDVMVADKIRLNQITLNLLSNAVKYTPPGGTVTYLSDSEKLPDGRIRFDFEIRDTGIGMSEEFQKHMFEPFTQEYDNPERQKGLTGTGLGLSIVKRDVELMDGTLTVHSAPGIGTSIRCSIVFPDALRDPRYCNVVQQTQTQPFLEQSTPLFGKVLLAEDNDINAEIAIRILESFGLEIIRTENGAEAVERFQASQAGEYCVILMDIQMPILNGYEATARIRSLPHPDAASIPIIAMTADAFADAVERGHRAGMNAYVTKPLDPVLLRTCLATEMNLRTKPAP